MTSLSEHNAATALAMSEKALQQNVMQIARALRFLAFHPYDSRRSEPGFPDLTLTNGVRLLFIEFKAQRGRLSPPQKTWLGALNGTAAEVYVIRPSDLISGRVHSILAGPRSKP